MIYSYLVIALITLLGAATSCVLCQTLLSPIVETSHPQNMPPVQIDFFHDSSTSSEFINIIDPPYANLSSVFGPSVTPPSLINKWNNGVDFHIAGIVGTAEDLVLHALHAGKVVYVRNQDAVQISSLSEFSWENVADNSTSFEAYRPNETVIVLECTLNSSIPDSNFHSAATLSTFWVLYSNFASSSANLDDEIDLAGEVAIVSTSTEKETIVHLEVWLQGKCTLDDQTVWLKDNPDLDKVANADCFTDYDPAVNPFLFGGNPYATDSPAADGRQLYQINPLSSAYNDFAVRYYATKKHLDVDQINSNMGNFSFNLKAALTNSVLTRVSRADSFTLQPVSASDTLFLAMTAGQDAGHDQNSHFWIDISFSSKATTVMWVEVVDVYGRGIMWTRSPTTAAPPTTPAPTTVAPATTTTTVAPTPAPTTTVTGGATDTTETTESTHQDASSSTASAVSGSGTSQPQSTTATTSTTTTTQTTISSILNGSTTTTRISTTTTTRPTTTQTTIRTSTSTPSTTEPAFFPTTTTAGNSHSGSGSSHHHSSSSTSSGSTGSSSASSSTSHHSSSSSTSENSGSSSNEEPITTTITLDSADNNATYANNTNNNNVTRQTTTTTTATTTTAPPSTTTTVVPPAPTTTPNPFTAEPISDTQALAVGFGGAALFFTCVTAAVIVLWNRWIRKQPRDVFDDGESYGGNDGATNPESVQMLSLGAGTTMTQVDASILDL